MALTLKRNKSYAESMGHPHIKFIQDDHFFNEQGEEIHPKTGRLVSELEAEAKEKATAGVKQDQTAPQQPRTQKATSKGAA